MSIGFLPRRQKAVQGSPWILAFSGPIQSGKSTVSVELGRILEVPVASFGRFVRDEAKARFVKSASVEPIEDRRRLQELGQELLEDLGAEKFCRAVLGAAGWVEGQPVVVDGVRHTEILTSLNQLGECYLVYLEADPVRRRAGLLASGYSDEDIAAMDNHPTERELQAVKERAALILADQPVDDLIEAVLKDERLPVGKRWSMRLLNEHEYDPDEARLGFRALHLAELVSPGGTDASRVARDREGGKIFAYENGEVSFPEWQFDDLGEPLPVIAEVLAYLRPHLTEAQVARWFVEAQQYLDGHEPYEFVKKDPLRVLAAARTAAALLNPDWIRPWKSDSTEQQKDSGGMREVHRWNAEVLQVDEGRGTFLARMVSAVGSFAPRDASFPIDQIHPHDRARLAEGATFTWMVTERDLSDVRQRCSTIVFSPPHYLSSTEIAEARDAADEMLKALED